MRVTDNVTQEGVENLILTFTFRIYRWGIDKFVKSNFHFLLFFTKTIPDLTKNVHLIKDDKGAIKIHQNLIKKEDLKDDKIKKKFMIFYSMTI